MNVGDRIYLTSFQFSLNTKNTGEGLLVNQEWVPINKIKNGKLIILESIWIPFKNIPMPVTEFKTTSAKKDNIVYVIMWSSKVSIEKDKWGEFKQDCLIEMSLNNMNDEIINIVKMWPFS